MNEQEKHVDCQIRVVDKFQELYVYEDDMTEEHIERRKQQAYKTLFQKYLTRYGDKRNMMFGNLREDPLQKTQSGRDVVGIVFATVYELIK